MRRLPAMLLLVLFSLSLIGPAVWANAESQLPECCRRLGQHHCAMTPDSAQGRPSGSEFRSNTDRCPYFPAGVSVPVPQHTPALSAAPVRFTLAVARSTRRFSVECLQTALVSRSHQKRGPPPLLP